MCSNNLRHRALAAAIVLICASSTGWAQRPPKPASEVEATLIRQVMGFEAPQWKDRILEFRAWRYPSDQDSPRLVGFLWLRPSLLRKTVCVVQQFAVSGNVQADKHNWESQQSYYYWEIGERGSCDIAGQAEIPDSLTTRDSIPTTALIQIMKNADELLRAAMARDDAPKLRHPTLHWRLAELSLSSVLQPDVGFGYHARYDAVGATAGPSVFFSLTDSGFEVHSVGEWVY